MLRRSFVKNSFISFLGISTSAGIAFKTGLLDKQIVKSAFLDFCSKFNTLEQFTQKTPDLADCYFVNLNGAPLISNFDFFELHASWNKKYQLEELLNEMYANGRLLALQVNYTKSQYSAYFLFKNKSDYLHYINTVQNITSSINKNNAWKWISIESSASIENSQLYISKNYSTVEQVI